MLWTQFFSVAKYPTRLRPTGYLSINYIQIFMKMFQIPASRLARILITDDMEHVIKMPSEGHISVWTDNDLKYIDPGEPHQIRILSRALGHIWI